MRESTESLCILPTFKKDASVGASENGESNQQE